jgi:hypothetical protein
MKKILIVMMIFLFTITMTGFGEIYGGRQEYKNSENSTGQVGALYQNSTGNAREETSGQEGALYRSLDPGALGGRPGPTGCIGCESNTTPVGDGLYVLIVGCLVFSITHFLLTNYRKKTNR